MKTYFYYVPMLLLASCTSELVEVDGDVAKGGDISKVVIQSHPFEIVGDGDTRTVLTHTETKLAFSWADRDAIGVFPVSPTPNCQAKQVLLVPEGTDAHYATFDGAGWELKDNQTYAAYSPYNGSLISDTRYSDVPIDFTGQDGTLATVGKKYDFMYAPSRANRVVTTEDGTREVVFDFKHKVAILILKLTMPTAATWKNVTLTNASGNDIWITSANLNVASGSYVAVTQSSTISLDLHDVKTTAPDEVVTLYASVLPKQSASGVLYVKATTDTGEEYVGTYASRSIITGKAFVMPATLSKKYESSGTRDKHAYVDFGFESGLKWATMNLGASAPTAVGDYYAWGETKPQTDNAYSWESYKWKGEEIKHVYSENGYSSIYMVSKYNISEKNGTIDNLTTLEVDDDAVIQNWGGAWRMPTREEQVELINNSYGVYTKDYNATGVPGIMLFKAKKDRDKGICIYVNKMPSYSYSLADAHIFIPISGWMTGGKLDIADDATLWSSSLEPNNVMPDPECGAIMFFTPNIGGEGGVDRWNGLNIRGVCK